MKSKKSVSRWHSLPGDIRRYPQLYLGAGFIIAVVIIAVAAPLIAPADPYRTDFSPAERLRPPSRAHLCGTDDLGRDIASRMIYGARVSLTVGLIAVAIMLLIGTLVGALAGYYGGWIDFVLMRVVEVMICVPTIFLILMILAFLGPSIVNVMVVIGLTSWAGLARLVRAEFLTLKEREFVLAARSLGASDARIIFRHILPNALAPVFVSATLNVGGAILAESALSFLGLGVQPPMPSWGNILTAGKFYLESAWWIMFFPGMAILLTVLSFNLIGEGLRMRLDPRLR